MALIFTCVIDTLVIGIPDIAGMIACSAMLCGLAQVVASAVAVDFSIVTFALFGDRVAVMPILTDFVEGSAMIIIIDITDTFTLREKVTGFALCHMTGLIHAGSVFPAIND